MTDARGRSVRLSTAQLAILTVVAVASLRSLPAMATYGLGSVTLYVIPAIVFLVPTALVSAELATGWNGGVYVWVREGLGDRLGFLAIWQQWAPNILWFPVQLAFIAASLAYVVADPALAGSGAYTAAVILVVYWSATLLTLRGGGLFARVGSIGGVVGTIIPGLVLVLLGAAWLGTGHPSEVPLQPPDVIPPFTGFAGLVLVVSNFVAYAGMEMNAVHANEMGDPGRQFPRAILVGSVVIVGIFILPTIAVAIAVPPASLGLADGILVAFRTFFDAFGIGWLTPVFAAAVAFGAIASVVTWIAGPSKGLLAAARTGLLPPALQRTNAAGVQVAILAVQGAVVTLLALLFVVVPDVDTAFFTLVDMTAAAYLVMYVLMFAAAIRLRRSAPQVVRSYRVPALPLVAGTGMVASVAALALAFVPPADLTGIPPHLYPIVIGGVVVGLAVPALILPRVRRASWDLRPAADVTAERRAMLVHRD